MSTGARRSWWCLLSRQYARGPACSCGHRHGQPFKPIRKRRREPQADVVRVVRTGEVLKVTAVEPDYGVALFDA